MVPELGDVQVVISTFVNNSMFVIDASGPVTGKVVP